MNFKCRNKRGHLGSLSYATERQPENSSFCFRYFWNVSSFRCPVFFPSPFRWFCFGLSTEVVRERMRHEKSAPLSWRTPPHRRTNKSSSLYHTTRLHTDRQAGHISTRRQTKNEQQNEITKTDRIVSKTFLSRLFLGMLFFLILFRFISSLSSTKTTKWNPVVPTCNPLTEIEFKTKTREHMANNTFLLSISLLVDFTHTHTHLDHYRSIIINVTWQVAVSSNQ